MKWCMVSKFSFPLNFRLAAELGMDLNEAQHQRMMQLNELNEVRQDALQQTTTVQQQRIKWHDKFIRKK